MRYLSVCSGIEAASVAWEPLGWRPAAFAEIDKFPAAVLAHHWPEVPNLGDLAKLKGEDFRGLVDLVVGGTPCQSFSVAGLREGLDDPRGDLTLKFFALLGQIRPRWLVWENVPGILSHDRGRTFGAVLRALAECGYGFAYRVLDAQYFGVPQRRRRVFVVGHLGDWRPPAAVLFERHSLSGHTPPGRSAGQKIAGSLASRFGRNGGAANGDVTGGRLVTHALTGGRGRRCDPHGETFIAQTLRGEGFDASEDGTGRQNLVVATVALRGREGGATAEMGGEVATALRSSQGGGDKPHVLAQTAVRRLTPLECERLQGFPEGHTLLKHWSGWRNLCPDEDPERLRAQGFQVRQTKKSGRWRVNDPDGPRYKALGNSMAVPVMRWLGERIGMVEEILRTDGNY